MPIRAEIRFRAKTIEMSRDIYSDQAKKYIMIKLSLCVIHVL